MPNISHRLRLLDITFKHTKRSINETPLSTPLLSPSSMSDGISTTSQYCDYLARDQTLTTSRSLSLILFLETLKVRLVAWQKVLGIKCVSLDTFLRIEDENHPAFQRPGSSACSSPILVLGSESGVFRKIRHLV